MFEGVGQRLLHDPVRGQVEPGGQRPGLTLDTDLDGQPGLADLLGQLGQVADARLRCQRRRVVLTQDAEQSTQLASACRPVSSTARSAGMACSGWSGSCIRAAPAWTSSR